MLFFIYLTAERFCWRCVKANRDASKWLSSCLIAITTQILPHNILIPIFILADLVPLFFNALVEVMATVI